MQEPYFSTLKVLVTLPSDLGPIFMFDNIISGLKDQIGVDLTSKAGVSPDKVDSVLQVVGQTARGKVEGVIASGGIATALSLFTKGTNTSGANGLLSGISGSIVENPISKLGLSPDIAAKLSAMAVPVLTNMVAQFNGKTLDNDASPLLEMFGGKGGGIANVAKSAFGGFFK